MDSSLTMTEMEMFKLLEQMLLEEENQAILAKVTEDESHTTPTMLTVAEETKIRQIVKLQNELIKLLKKRLN